MKQKNNQVKAKANANGVQRGNIGKQKNIAAVVQAKPVVVKNNKQLREVVAKNNKNKKTPKKTLPPKKIVEDDEKESEEGEEENSENEDDSGADVEADADEPASESDEESDNEELDDDIADEDDENQESNADDDAAEIAEQEDDNNASSDDDEPVEKPIGKKRKADQIVTQVGIPKIKCSDIPRNFPNDQVIVVQNLPKKGAFKQVDLYEVFSKYGTLDTIKPVYKKDALSIAYIAYTTAKAAKAALAADKAEINGSVVTVIPRPLNKETILAEEKKKRLQEEAEKRKQFESSGDRSLFIKNIKPGTSPEALRDHFASCGEIELVKIVPRNNFNYGFITFAESASAQAALKFNNTVMNNATIGVYINGDLRSKLDAKDPKRTVILKNVKQFESFPGDKIEAIFAKCGEIEHIDVVCKKNVLAFCTFKNEDSVSKALAMNGTTEGDIEMEVTEYQAIKKTQNTSVFMINVKAGATETEIREFFAETGEISNVFLKMGFAIVKFANTDGFCKAFLQNEAKLLGQPVFLEPYSEQKKRVMRAKKDFGGKKRSYPFKKNNGGNNFKKPKLNED